MLFGGIAFLCDERYVRADGTHMGDSVFLPLNPKAGRTSF